MVDPLSYFTIQCSMTGVTNAVVCYPVCGMMHIRTLAANPKEKPMWRQRVSSRYLSGPLPYASCHITVNKMCCVHR